MATRKTTGTTRGRKNAAQEPDLSAIKVPVPEGKALSKLQTDYPKGVAYEERVVAFIDILGFKEWIGKSAKQAELLHRIHAALDIRIDGFAQAFAPLVDLKMTPNDFDDRFHSFSDFIVMSVRRDICEIGLLVFAVFKVCRTLLSYGFASRGGIAMGDLYHRHNDPENPTAPPMVFGPAFVDAYTFESTHADGPRVILQNKVWQHIDRKCDERPSSKLSQFLRTHVHRAEDGPTYINIFADLGTSAFYEFSSNMDTELQAIHKHICTALDESSDRPHQFKKNAQLAREFNAALESAGLTRHLIPRTKLPKKAGAH
ncbi:hypothetical protein [Burkholderia pseudomallei]|uniref:hypothetical protein n=1 Tax=Burkholderia pseudomallei TaxID=28450 RepID=UPI001F50956E|nr:hypothetical protein [Burkholderia pseudomallei]